VGHPLAAAPLLSTPAIKNGFATLIQQPWKVDRRPLCSYPLRYAGKKDLIPYYPAIIQ